MAPKPMSTTKIQPDIIPPPPSGSLWSFLDLVLNQAPPGNGAWTAAFDVKSSLSYAAPETVDAFWMKVYVKVLLPHVVPHATEEWTELIHEQWSALMIARQARRREGGGNVEV